MALAAPAVAAPSLNANDGSKEPPRLWNEAVKETGKGVMHGTGTVVTTAP
jgi:hypothetical protein